MTQVKQIAIHVDGACTGNPGPGGYGVILDYQGYRKEISGGFRMTTNNRMEVMGVVVALESLKGPCETTIYSDSQYLVRAMTEGWARRWKANNWRRNKKDKVLNPDLWDRLLNLCDRHRTSFIWVKGHNANPENERCDQLATEAAGKHNLPADPGYESIRA
ncbi:MAG: ribonuclease HI [Chloroflexi bacterium]|nr:ribonuclease HI [Chloroflexota bacterium]